MIIVSRIRIYFSKLRNIIDEAEFVKICTFKVLMANDVNLWHTSLLRVMKGVELKSAVCQPTKNGG